MKKFIKLINNERTNLKINAQKASVDCSDGARDTCGVLDQAACTTYALDKCATYDLAACIDGAHDYCEGSYDTVACYGPGVLELFTCMQIQRRDIQMQNL